MSKAGPPTVAILNTNDDTVEMLRLLLETEGLVAVSAHVDEIRRGQFDFGGFIEEHNPRVIIYDLPPPYDRSWLFLEHLRNLPSMRGRQLVLTSTNPARVHQVVERGERADPRNHRQTVRHESDCRRGEAGRRRELRPG